MAKSTALATTRRRTSPARRNKPRRRGGFTVPLTIVGGLLPTAVGIWNRRSSGTQIADYVMSGFTGFTPSTNTWNWTNLKSGLLPVVAGAVAHRVAGAIGINRMLSRARIPFIRV